MKKMSKKISMPIAPCVPSKPIAPNKADYENPSRIKHRRLKTLGIITSPYPSDSVFCSDLINQLNNLSQEHAVPLEEMFIEWREDYQEYDNGYAYLSKYVNAHINVFYTDLEYEKILAQLKNKYLRDLKNYEKNLKRHEKEMEKYKIKLAKYENDVKEYEEQKRQEEIELAKRLMKKYKSELCESV